jgi:hypothetical protein
VAIPPHPYTSGLFQLKRHKDLPTSIMCLPYTPKSSSSLEFIHLAIQQSLCPALPTLRSPSVSITNHVWAPSMVL